MECERRGLLDREFAFLKGLERTAGIHEAELGFASFTKRVATMRLAKTHDIEFLDSGWEDSIDYELGVLHL